jgi:hypothetical protein
MCTPVPHVQRKNCKVSPTESSLNFYFKTSESSRHFHPTPAPGYHTTIHSFIMYRSLHLFALLPLFLTPTLALPRPEKGVPTYKPEGSCPSHAFPTEEQYRWGWNDFCTRFYPAANRANADNTSLTLWEDFPMVATYGLPAYDGSMVQWVYRVQDVYEKDDKNDRLPYHPDNCKHYFNKLVDDPQYGGLGVSYCVVDGTGGDWFGGVRGVERMSGEGVVLVMGGKEEPKLSQEEKEGEGHGFIRYESRKKNGP